MIEDVHIITINNGDVNEYHQRTEVTPEPEAGKIDTELPEVEHQMENWKQNMQKTTDTLTEGVQTLQKYFTGDSGGLLNSLSDLLDFDHAEEETSTDLPIRSYPPKPQEIVKPNKVQNVSLEVIVQNIQTFQTTTSGLPSRTSTTTSTSTTSSTSLTSSTTTTSTTSTR